MRKGDIVNPKAIALQSENIKLEKEVQALNNLLHTGIKKNSIHVSFDVLDYFYTVECMGQADDEINNLQKKIEQELIAVFRDRKAMALAENMRAAIELEKKTEEQNIDAAIERLATAVPSQEARKNEEKLGRNLSQRGRSDYWRTLNTIERNRRNRLFSALCGTLGRKRRVVDDDAHSYVSSGTGDEEQQHAQIRSDPAKLKNKGRRPRRHKNVTGEPDWLKDYIGYSD